MTCRCAVCGSEQVTPRLVKDGIEIRECGECRLQFWLPPSDFLAKDVYGSEYFAADDVGLGYDDYAGLEAALRVNFARRFEAMQRPGAGDRLLDIGAAYGYAVDEARRAGWSAFGLEVSQDAARQAARVDSGRRVVAADAIATPFSSGSFRALTLWDVLEHLPDPHAALAEANRLLPEGGILALTTGDSGSLLARLSGARWHLYTLPEHLYFYSRPSLERLLEAHGFEIDSMRAESALYPLGYLVERLRKSLLGFVAKPSSTQRAENSRDRRGWSLHALRVPVNLFDIVTVVAHKRRTTS